MEQSLVKHENALASWIRLRVGRDGAVTTVLRVDTDLCLDAEDPDYRPDAVKSLVAAAVAHIRDHAAIESVELEQASSIAEVTSIGY